MGTAAAGVGCCEGGKRGALPAVGPTLSGVTGGKSMSGFDTDVGQLFCYRPALHPLQQVTQALQLLRTLTSCGEGDA